MRRNMLKGAGAALVAGTGVLHYAGKVNAQEAAAAGHGPAWARPPLEPGRRGEDYQPVVTPNGVSLEYRVVDGIKVYHLIAEPVRHEFAPGLEANVWGFNGRVHGPTIEAVEGDRVRIYVTNRLPAETSIHWHGVLLPSGMDGVAGLNQAPIRPGETFKYEWTFHQHGMLMYHSHHDEMTQMAMGMMGALVVHPRRAADRRPVDRDFALLLSEWAIHAGTERPDPNEMGALNIFTINAKAFPGTAPLVVRTGDRVRIRIANLSADSHHPIHIHGHKFDVVETDGGVIPEAGRWPETTVIMPVGSTRTIEFVADNPGDWGLHCHMTHHIMNQMGHGIPNMIGFERGNFDERMRSILPGYMTMGETGMGDHGVHVEAGHMRVPENSIPMVGKRGPRGYITMGGMVTILKVRDELESYDVDPGWYENPEGTEARLAREEELRRDGVDVVPREAAPARGGPGHEGHH
ncbi:multicopper oxidase family protein [Billgrantia desiderata]|uniref:multicopper oxidase family protein n=1 Tax=Billgrantia desiderata TaxID=52021 RepID=UPI001F428075|nr:copper oxidase [Halomonas desiderata]